jgi:hypothetical protein
MQSSFNNYNERLNSRLSMKAKLPFSNVMNRNLSSATANNRNSRLIVNNIDGTSSMTMSLNKPTPPKKPAHVKAASVARKLAKQQQDTEFDRMKKSESSPRIGHQLLDNNNKDRMKKSTTNPEKMADLLNEKLSLLDDDDDEQEQNRKVIKTSQKLNNDIHKSNDRLNAGDMLNDKSDELVSNENVNLYADDNKPSNQISQLIDFNDNKEETTVTSDLITPTDKNEEDEMKRKIEEEEEEQKKLESEEMRSKAMEEERKRLAKEEKERELELKKKLELERRVKEKAEKARLEMEERLKKDEQERIERKKVKKDNFHLKFIILYMCVKNYK